MTWTYTGNPATVVLDEVRLLLGDVDLRVPLVQDEVLNWLLDKHDDVEAAVAEAAEGLISRWAHQPVVTHPGGTVDYGPTIDRLRALVDRLRRGRVGAPVWTGFNPKPGEEVDILFDVRMRG